MRAFFVALLIALGLLPAGLRAETATRPIVVELFTSQGCSSCPPADALLRDLSRRRGDVLALAFHVTYWDRLGWADPFALPAATARQRGYAGIAQVGTIYTPQMVVEGRTDVVGSDRRGVEAALAAAHPAAATRLSLEGDAANVRITVAEGQGAGRVLLIGYDPEHRTMVTRGENSGSALVEANIVRGLDEAGAWTGAALTLQRKRPAGEKLAVIVQAPDGSILAALRGD
jgi:hypothetical protein